MEKETDARAKANIIEAEKAAKSAREAIDKARRAGIDVTEPARRLAEVEARVARARAVYIEGR